MNFVTQKCSPQTFGENFNYGWEVRTLTHSAVGKTPKPNRLEPTWEVFWWSCPEKKNRNLSGTSVISKPTRSLQLQWAKVRTFQRFEKTPNNSSEIDTFSGKSSQKVSQVRMYCRYGTVTQFVHKFCSNFQKKVSRKFLSELYSAKCAHCSWSDLVGFEITEVPDKFLFFFRDTIIKKPPRSAPSGSVLEFSPPLNVPGSVLSSRN